MQVRQPAASGGETPAANGQRQGPLSVREMSLGDILATGRSPLLPFAGIVGYRSGTGETQIEKVRNAHEAANRRALGEQQFIGRFEQLARLIRPSALKHTIIVSATPTEL